MNYLKYLIHTIFGHDYKVVKKRTMEDHADGAGWEAGLRYYTEREIETLKCDCGSEKERTVEETEKTCENQIKRQPKEGSCRIESKENNRITTTHGLRPSGVVDETFLWNKRFPPNNVRSTTGATPPSESEHSR